MLVICVEDPLRVGILILITVHPPVYTGKSLCSWVSYDKKRHCRFFYRFFCAK